MDHPSQGALNVLTELHAIAKERDTEDGEVEDVLRMLVRDYTSWLDGSLPHERGLACATEHFMLAKDRARALGFLDISAGLIALWPSDETVVLVPRQSQN